MEPTFRVAVVEDNPPQRMIVTRLLEKEYIIEAFASGGDFLASEAKFDAVLLDIEMPDLSGYDTCRHFRDQARGAETPVIFVSAHDTPPERVAAYEAGGDDFVTKPIASHELNHKLRSAIEHCERVRALTSETSAAQQVAFTAMVSMGRSEEHTSELQSHHDIVCRRLLEKKKKNPKTQTNIKRQSESITTSKALALA